jgi:hypothetical protein
VNVLAIDVGGTHIKVLAKGESEPRRFPSGTKMTPKQMVKGVKQITKDWKYDARSDTLGESFEAGQSRSHITWLVAGSDLISKLHSDVR